MNLRAQALLLPGFVGRLNKEELNKDEQEVIGTSLNTPEALSFLMLIAAAHRRTKTLEFLISLSASSKSIEQWITQQTISNIFMQELRDTVIPVFDSVFAAAIANDDADYIEFLATAISAEVSAIIIAKLLALPEETKLKLTNIKGKVVALNDDAQGILEQRARIDRFAQAVITGDLLYIGSGESGTFATQHQAYFVLLAAAHLQTLALRFLTDNREFSITAIEQWVQGAAIPLPDYCPIKIDIDCKTVLLKAIQAGNLAYLQQMKLFLNPKLCALLQSESVQVELTLAATAADNAEILEFLTNELACVLVAKDYSWQYEGVYEREYTEYPRSTYGYYEESKPVVKKETVYPKPWDSLPYRHALLAAANKEKLTALAWLLTRSFEGKKALFERCRAMTHEDYRAGEVRPKLKAFFDARQKQCLSDMSLLALEEVETHISSLEYSDQALSALVAACERGDKELVYATLYRLDHFYTKSKGLDWHPDNSKEKDRKYHSELRDKAAKDPFEHWLLRMIEGLFAKSDPRVIRLLKTEFEKFSYDNYSSWGHSCFPSSLSKALQVLRSDHLKLTRIAEIKDKFSSGLLSAQDLTFLTEALSTTRFVNELGLVRPIFESTLKSDNLAVFYTLFLIATKDDDTRAFATYHTEPRYPSVAAACLVEAAKFEAVDIFRAVHTAFGNNALDRYTRRQLREICDDGKHTKIKATLESVLAVTVVRQSIFSTPRVEETASVAPEKKM